MNYDVGGLDLALKGEWLRHCGREAEARTVFRRACALEARAARAETDAWNEAIMWRSAGWCAIDAARPGAAMRCADYGLTALAATDDEVAIRRLAPGLHELRAEAERLAATSKAEGGGG